MRTIATLVLGYSMTLSLPLWGQGKAEMRYTIQVTGRVLGEFDGEPVKGAIVIVRRGTHSEEMHKVARNGKYTVELARGSNYEIIYSAPGQVAKRVVIDTRGAPAMLDVPTITMVVDITLFPPIEGLDTRLFTEPMGKAGYKHSVRNIVWDKEYGEEMRARIKRYMAGHDKKANGRITNGEH